MFRVAVFGLGWWGPKLLRNVARHPLVTKVIGVDPSSSRREQVAKDLNVKTVANPEAIFSDQTIDAVIIATPPETHYDLASAALESNKDVLLTKPPTKTIDELADLTACATAHERIFMMDSTFIYSDPVRKMKEVLDKGLFKEIRFVQSLRYGNDLRMHHVDRLRNTMLANGVNVIEDLIFHDMAILNYLLHGWKYHTKAVHRVNTLSSDPYLCDTAFVRLEADSFPVHIGLSWTLPERRREFIIADGEKQLIYNDLSPDAKLKIFWIVDKKEELIEYGSKEPLSLVIEHFLHCIQDRTTPLTDGNYMLDVMRSFNSVLSFSG